MGKDSEDFLSRAVINISDIKVSDGDGIPTPEWHKLYYKKGGPVSGEVLLSFAVVPGDYNFNKSLKHLKLEKEVEMKEYGVQM